jgi:hypothetical protein
LVEGDRIKFEITRSERWQRAFQHR